MHVLAKHTCFYSPDPVAQHALDELPEIDLELRAQAEPDVEYPAAIEELEEDMFD